MPEDDEMSGCEDVRARFPDLLTGSIPADERAAAEGHLARCADCSRELEAVEAAWRTLASAPELRAPAAVRRSVVERARRAVAADVEEASSFSRRLWTAVRGLAGPVALGAAAALLVVFLLQLRGVTSGLSSAAVAVTSVLFAAALATAAGGVLQSGASREVRGIFAAALGSLGGYVVLTLLSPIPETVDFCRVTLMGDPALGLTQICLVYLGVAALYAGAPMAIAAYRWPGRDTRWKAGALEAGIFILLAAPVAIFQFGLTEWMITATGLLGLLVGAVLGGLVGGWAGSRRMAPGR